MNHSNDNSHNALLSIHLLNINQFITS